MLQSNVEEEVREWELGQLGGDGFPNKSRSCWADGWFIFGGKSTIVFHVLWFFCGFIEGVAGNSYKEEKLCWI